MANERLKQLRALMAQHGMDVYYIPSSDFHDSEYVDPYFKCREFISGFTGSAGTMVVTKDFTGLWTDGRYFVQAKKQLEGQDTELMKMGEENVPTIDEFLMDHLPEGGVLGMDGRVVNTGIGRSFEKLLKVKKGTASIEHDLAGELWTERPELPAPQVWVLEEKYAGESVASKIARIRQVMKEHHATVHILSGLDDIAWLLNIRKNTGASINLLPLAHVLMTMDALTLFIDSSRFDDGVNAYLKENGVTLAPYGDIYRAVKELRNETILLEPDKVNYAMYKSIHESCLLEEAMNPASWMKAMKNPVEMENLRKAHIKDGVALTKFIYWMKTKAPKGSLMETEAAEHLESLRKEQEGYICPSFDTISAYGANAAMCHYHATTEEESVIGKDGFYLVDSGGQYYEGTTDVTRTIVMGELTHEEKLHFTLVLMGMLRLTDAKFLHGCRGINVDYLARGPLWKLGLDFNHGTGHGVGYLSNVHERPNGIRWKIVPERQDSCILEEGMLTSNEPGLYIEGSHGIRTENLLLCRKAEKNGYGQFMRFETMTYAPIDTEAVDISVMEPSDVRLLNQYHKDVYEKLSPYLTKEEAEWLKDVTKPIGGDAQWHI